MRRPETENAGDDVCWESRGSRSVTRTDQARKKKKEQVLYKRDRSQSVNMQWIKKLARIQRTKSAESSTEPDSETKRSAKSGEDGLDRR